MAEDQYLGDALASNKVRIETAVERALEKSNGTDRLLIIADQFEELFTLTPEQDRLSFIRALLQATARTRLTVLPTLRADFYGHAIGLSRELSDLLERNVVNVGPMTRDNLENAIMKPAERAGLKFEPGLVQQVLDDLSNEPGNLPLLEFALADLWNRRQGRTLTHSAYRAIGGVDGAIAVRAETEFARFRPDQQAAARYVFKRLVRVARPEDGGEDTRRRADMREFNVTAHGVVRALAGARLLVMSRDWGCKTSYPGEENGYHEMHPAETAEVAHEALIRRWPRVRAWLNEDREFLLWQQRLHEQMLLWNSKDRDDSILPRGALLDEAERWLRERAADLDEHERNYVQQACALRSIENRRRERRRRSLIRASVGVATILLLVIAWAVVQWQRSAAGRRIAIARQLAAEADLMRHSRPNQVELSTLLALESVQRDPELQTYQALRESLALLPRPVVWLNRAGPSSSYRGSCDDVVFSADGRYLAISDLEGVQLFESATWRALGGLTNSVAFSSDGRYVATGSSDENAVRVYNAASRQELARLKEDDWVHAIVFSPDGLYLAIGGRDGTARFFETRKWQEVSRSVHKGGAVTVAFSLDGRYAAIGGRDNTAMVYEVGSWKDLSRVELTGAVNGITFTHDARYVVTAGEDGIETVFQSTSGRKVAVLTCLDRVNAGAFSPNGRYLVGGNNDSTAVLYDLGTGKHVALSHEDSVKAVVFSPAGRYLATVAVVTDSAAGRENFVRRCAGKPRRRFTAFRRWPAKGKY